MSEQGNDLSALLRRIQRLEDIEAIRKLKARYLNACDDQDPAAVRATFAPDGQCPVIVGHLGVFDTADGFCEMYTAQACHPWVLDKHQAGNGEIDIIDDTHAKGLWCLDYRKIDTKDETITFVSLQYHDDYEKIDGAWKIRKTRSEFRTGFFATYKTGTLQALVAGKSVADAPLNKI
ncbi:MAG TPA: nuclear transport factor 2 family protein [Alphaproteobacteria bacterium]|nr:nuclear transport factor 2 family protein [Alphaproteobacteria bacterium]